jgi:GTP-binding protein EngB required for normal cell division/uncharacterized protein (DUF697 family)
MSDNNYDYVHDLAEKCRKKIEEFENIKVRCGLIGPSGSGKSSLINAIVDEKIAPVGVVETTTDPQEFTHEGIIFTDLPGCGTVKWPKDNYIKKLNLLSYDCFLLVTAERFTENDVFLFRELSADKKLCFVIRNKFDRAIDDGKYDNGLEELETRRIITVDIYKNLEPGCPNKVYLTSARHPTKYDLPNLLDDISEGLSDLKRKRFIADMGAYSNEALEKKSEVARGIIPWHAGLSAANGLNPIPGVDIAADISILIKLASKVMHIYGFTDSQFDYIKRLLRPNAVPGLVAKIVQFTAKYLTQQGIVSLLKRIATKAMAKQAAKYVPFVGPLIAVGIGWQATFILGDQLVNEAEELAKEILDEIINSESGSPHL